VVDSNDRERMDSPTSEACAARELHRMLAEDELRDACLLVFCNKQDLPNALSVADITERLKLSKIRNRSWYVQATCAITGEGLYEGLDWIADILTKDN